MDDAKRAVVLAWRAWLRAELPVENARQNRVRAPTLGVEEELDHLRSYVHTLVGRFMAGERADYAERIARHREVLDATESSLSSLPAAEADRRPLQTFIDRTRTLLDALEQVSA